LERRLSNQLVFHGAIVMLLGLLAGFPFAWVIGGTMEGDLRAWRMAHLEGVLNSLLLLAVAGFLGRLALDARKQTILTWALVVTAYGNIVASIIGAATGNRGLEPTGPAANMVVFVLFIVAIVAVVVALGLLVYGARPGGHPSAAKVSIEVSERSVTRSTPISTASATVTSVTTNLGSDDDDDDDDDDDGEPMSRAERRRRKKRGR
jgi:hypothetical protein